MRCRRSRFDGGVRPVLSKTRNCSHDASSDASTNSASYASPDAQHNDVPFSPEHYSKLLQWRQCKGRPHCVLGGGRTLPPHAMRFGVLRAKTPGADPKTVLGFDLRDAVGVDGRVTSVWKDSGLGSSA